MSRSALPVACPFCDAPAGEPCRGARGKPYAAATPAHGERLRELELAARTVPPVAPAHSSGSRAVHVELMNASARLLRELGDDGLTPKGLEAAEEALAAYVRWRDSDQWDRDEHGAMYVLAEALLLFVREADSADGVTQNGAWRLNDQVRWAREALS